MEQVGAVALFYS